MKRLLLVAVMVLVSLVGMVGFSRDAESQNEPLTMSEISNAVRALEATANPTTGAVTELEVTVNAGDEYSPYYDPDKGAVIEPPATLNAGVQAKRKMYYLTVTGFTGGDAITACDSGFHMAGISEIQDPSNVQYAPRSTTVYDSLVALVDLPPSTRSTTRSRTVYDSLVALVDPPLFDQASDQFPDHTGWVRTEADPLTGLGYNCDVWRSSSDQQSGTTMTRRSLWGENNGHSLYEESDPAAWWQSTRTASCSQPEPVWCAENSERANVNPVTDTRIEHAFEFGD
jgi:hypothetical protein